MKKLFLILVLGLFFAGNASTFELEDFPSVNSLLEKGYELHSTNIIKSGQYQYNLVSNGSNGKHRLVTCIYSLEANVSICWVP